MRQQGRSGVRRPLGPPLLPLAHLTLPDLPNPSPSPNCPSPPHHPETIRHCSHKPLFVSHEVVVSLLHHTSHFCSLCLLFCYSLARPVSSQPPLPSRPPVYSLGYGLRAQRFGVSPWKLNKDKDVWRIIRRLCHIDSSLTRVLRWKHNGFFAKYYGVVLPLDPPVHSSPC